MQSKGGRRSSEEQQDSGKSEQSAGAKRRQEDEEQEAKQEKAQKKQRGASAASDEHATGDSQKAQEVPQPAQDAKLSPGKEDTGAGQDDAPWEVLEKGHVFFFYRPKVKSAHEVDQSGKAAECLDDVQNAHMLLLPHASRSETAGADATKDSTGSGVQGGTNGQQNAPAGTTGDKAKQDGVGFRVVRLGKKRLPAPEVAIANGQQPGGIGGDASETVWSVVADVGPDPAVLSGSMGEQRYNTRTQGERVVGPSRPAGRGWYALSLHKSEPPSSREVRLSFSISHPSEDEFGDVQSQLGLTPSGSFSLSMRNPTLPSTGAGAPPAGLDESARVQMSEKEIQDTFGGDAEGKGTRYARPEQIELLDREGVELLLIREAAQTSKGGAKTGTGEEQAKALEELAAADADRLSTHDVLAQLKMTAKSNPPNALEGQWV
ncbi:hypothetical protein IE81DRAFT_321244 [Ceraceosorus guamensis]|uniref:Uncharacterized protein n=1 Tax=Ceraceosorus guamensis TaxID=1522189 RepID=A0A316W4F3_9BASI|nr:hypothetical protein IE81DRAFT_321244 [Ceraceosorus guamensis]PWN44619.1 hypothetical protein IE81DRAFT_321244 [Ceraceosorus guamensis]